VSIFSPHKGLTCMPNTFVCVSFDLFKKIGFFIVYCNPKVSCFSLFNLIEFIEAYASFEEKLEAYEGEFWARQALEHVIYNL